MGKGGVRKLQVERIKLKVREEIVRLIFWVLA